MDKKLVEQLVNEQGENSYQTEVQVSASVEGYDIDPIKATVAWTFEMEARSWGIKGIEGFLKPESKEFEFEGTKEGTDELAPIWLVVDMAQLRVDWVASGYMAPVAIELYVDKEGEVDYNLSHLDFGFPTKG